MVQTMGYHLQYLVDLGFYCDPWGQLTDGEGRAGDGKGTPTATGSISAHAKNGGYVAALASTKPGLQGVEWGWLEPGIGLQSLRSLQCSSYDWHRTAFHSGVQKVSLHTGLEF